MYFQKCKQDFKDSIQFHITFRIVLETEDPDDPHLPLMFIMKMVEWVDKIISFYAFNGPRKLLHEHYYTIFRQ